MNQVAGIVTPDTILRWHRRLIAKKYGRGRPMTPRKIAGLVVRMASENPRWGYTRIRRALANLGHDVSRNTVKRILQDHGIEPGEWMAQMARNLTGAVDGFLRDASHLIHDRDPLYTVPFLEILASSGVRPIRLPPRSPNLNASAERFVRSIKKGMPQPGRSAWGEAPTPHR